MGHAVVRGVRTMRGLMLAFTLLLGAFTLARAQGTNQIGQIFITDSNTERYPTVQLRLYGKDGHGNPIDFATEPLFISHNGYPVDEIGFDGRVPVGTLTVFLIDVAGGANDQIPGIVEAIKQYASPNNMMEQLDYVAVYQIRANGPQQLLAPTPFYNGIINLFTATQLEAEEGSTSLYDGVIDVIGRMEELRPQPNMAASIVLISDGTDPGTAQAQPDDVIHRAVDAGIPIHTLHLENHALGAGVELGRTYLQDLATGSRGVAAELASAEGLAAVWSRIGQFRDHSWIHYIVPEPSGGLVKVEVRLADDRDVVATTEVNISTIMPSVVIDLPPESRNLTLPNLDKPVELQLSAAVSWLDGQKREVTTANLRVNGQDIAGIPPAKLGSFQVAVPNLAFGDNRLEVVVTDNQGITSTSAPLIITITQGKQREVPEALQPSGPRFGWGWLLWLVALAALAGGGYWYWRNHMGAAGPAAEDPSRRKRRRRRSPTDGAVDSKPGAGRQTEDNLDFLLFGGDDQGAPFVMAHLEVLGAQTLMPQELNLGDTEVRIGRSPAQAQIAFRDDITVSRLHAVLRLEGNRYRIYDAGSTSGTYVNDRPVPEYGLQLADGDELQMGAVRLRYRQL